MELKSLISECSAYDFKLMLEEKKPKSWLKSVSAFANGLGGSLFFGIANDGTVRGLDNVQHVCEFISLKVRDYMDPLPDVEMVPHEIDGLHVLQLKVTAGHYTPYYYVGDGQRIAFVRIGDESLPATAEQMVRLVQKGTNKTFDSLHTDYKAEDYSFTILANTFKDRTKQEWNKKYLLSFGLVSGDGRLTNAGALLADDCPLWQSRLYCTRWNGKRIVHTLHPTFENNNCKKRKMLPLYMGPCSQKLIEHNWAFCKDICSLRNIDVSIEEYVKMRCAYYLLAHGEK